MNLQQPHAAPSSHEEAFYADLLRIFNATGLPYRVGGTCAVNLYVGLRRITKDLDIFCRPGDYPRLLAACADAGYDVEVEDERWIAKVGSGVHFIDIVFGSANAVTPVTDRWLEEQHPGTVLGMDVLLLPPTELIWSKVFILDRVKYDGNDVVHLILKAHDRVDWKRLLSYMDQHWEVLLMHALNFRFAYPSERDMIPAWLLDELLSRLAAQRRTPSPRKRVCRGRIFSRSDFLIDVEEWGFADLIGDDRPPRDGVPHEPTCGTQQP